MGAMCRCELNGPLGCLQRTNPLLPACPCRTHVITTGLFFPPGMKLQTLSAAVQTVHFPLQAHFVPVEFKWE